MVGLGQGMLLNTMMRNNSGYDQNARDVMLYTECILHQSTSKYIKYNGLWLNFAQREQENTKLIIPFLITLPIIKWKVH